MGGICLRAPLTVLNCFKIHTPNNAIVESKANCFISSFDLVPECGSCCLLNFVSSSNTFRNGYLLMYWFEIVYYFSINDVEIQMKTSTYCKHLLQVQYMKYRIVELVIHNTVL